MCAMLIIYTQTICRWQSVYHILSYENSHYYKTKKESEQFIEPVSDASLCSQRLKTHVQCTSLARPWAKTLRFTNLYRTTLHIVSFVWVSSVNGPGFRSKWTLGLELLVWSVDETLIIGAEGGDKSVWRALRIGLHFPSSCIEEFSSRNWPTYT